MTKVTKQVEYPDFQTLEFKTQFKRRIIMFQVRKTAALVITSVFAASTLLSASAQSTGKSLSSNFTLVNLQSGPNNGQIQYVLQNGGEWRPSETFSLNGIGDLVIKRQYSDQQL